jgi:hypothetical protein
MLIVSAEFQIQHTFGTLALNIDLARPPSKVTTNSVMFTWLQIVCFIRHVIHRKDLYVEIHA